MAIFHNHITNNQRIIVVEEEFLTASKTNL
jgi:hypothetical protein